MPTGDRQPPQPPAGRRQRGFTYLWLLFALALGGVALAAVGEQERTRQQREREADLRFRGEAIANALQHYAQNTPVGRLPLPQSLTELLEDKRGPVPVRHLRQLYSDPLTGRPDWELVWGDAPLLAPDSPDTPGAATEALPPGRRSKGQPPAEAASQPGAGRGIVGVRSSSGRRLLATRGLRPGQATAHDLVFMAPLAPSRPNEPQP